VRDQILLIVALPLLLITILSAAAAPLGEPGSQSRFSPDSKENRTGVIRGSALKYERDLRTNLHGREPVVGVEVTLMGNEVFLKTTTDLSGNFRFTRLPGGNYKLLCRPPEHLIPSLPLERDVELRPGANMLVDFRFRNDGGIRGRIADVSGALPSDIRLDLVLAYPEYPAFPKALYAHPDAEGRFQFGEIPPGQYLVGIRLDGNHLHTFPYPRFYYPGVADPEKATVIALAEGQSLVLDDMKLPRALAQRTIQGKVSYSDGSPAANAIVALDLVEYPYRLPGGTTRCAPDGRFAVKAFQGLKYVVRAVGIPGRSGGPLRSESIEASRDGDVTNDTITLSTPVRSENVTVHPL